MQDHQSRVPTAPERIAWNKGKLIGAKPPLRPKHVWAIRTKLQIQGRTRDLAMFNLAIDSKLRVMSSRSRLRTLPRMDMRSTAQRSVRRRPACRSDSRSPSTPARQSTITFVPPVENQAISCSEAAVDEARASQHGNTLAWSPDGSGALALIPAGSARIHCAEPRPR
jgi:hypothetical protein